MPASESGYDESMKSLQTRYNDFKKKNLSKPGIGKLYERQIRYIYEKNGWFVKPYGILKGRSDLGRDLLCYKKKQIHIVQAKCWSRKRTIFEKHIMQLAGTILHYINKHKKKPQGVFITTAKLSPTAKDFVKSLNIKHSYIKLDKNFPMIKCNINRRGKKLFFLPFDKFYDRVHIEKKKGEFYTDSINECIKKGFKHVGKN